MVPVLSADAQHARPAVCSTACIDRDDCVLHVAMVSPGPEVFCSILAIRADFLPASMVAVARCNTVSKHECLERG